MRPTRLAVVHTQLPTVLTVAKIQTKYKINEYHFLLLLLIHGSITNTYGWIIERMNELVDVLIDGQIGAEMDANQTANTDTIETVSSIHPSMI